MKKLLILLAAMLLALPAFTQEVKYKYEINKRTGRQDMVLDSGYVGRIIDNELGVQVDSIVIDIADMSTAADTVNYPSVYNSEVGFNVVYTVTWDTIAAVDITLDLQESDLPSASYATMRNNNTLLPYTLTDVYDKVIFHAPAIKKYGRIVLAKGSATEGVITIVRKIGSVYQLGGIVPVETDTLKVIEIVERNIAGKVNEADSTAGIGHYASNYDMVTGLAGKLAWSDTLTKLATVYDISGFGAGGVNDSTTAGWGLLETTNALRVDTAAGKVATAYDLTSGMATKAPQTAVDTLPGDNELTNKLALKPSWSDTTGTNGIASDYELTTVSGMSEAAVAAIVTDSLVGSVPTYFIAASNATWNEKKVANVVCDGTADDVQLIAALVAGYHIKLSTGTFTIADDITAAVDNITIEGSGLSTIVTAVNSLNTVMFRVAGNGWQFKNFKVDGNSSGQNSTNAKGIYANGAYADLHVENVYFYDMYAEGAFFGNGVNRFWVTNCVFDGSVEGDNLFVGGAGTTRNGHINNCHFFNATYSAGVGIHVYALTGNLIENIAISSCTFSGSAGYLDIYIHSTEAAPNINNVTITGCTSLNAAGFRVEGANEVSVTGNTLSNIDHSGILVQGASRMVTLSNNVIDSTKYGGIDIQSIESKYPGIISITNNIISRALDQSSAAAGISVQVGVTDLIIQGNLIDSCYFGIYLNTAVHKALIAVNKITRTQQGIRLTDADYTRVFGNTLSCSQFGLNIAAATTSTARITENDFDDCVDDVNDEGTGTVFGINIWADGSYDNTP